MNILRTWSGHQRSEEEEEEEEGRERREGFQGLRTAQFSPEAQRRPSPVSGSPSQMPGSSLLRLPYNVWWGERETMYNIGTYSGLMLPGHVTFGESDPKQESQISWKFCL